MFGDVNDHHAVEYEFHGLVVLLGEERASELTPTESGVVAEQTGITNQEAKLQSSFTEEVDRPGDS